MLDRFPAGFSESDINTEALAAFCFPNGLKVRLIPRCAMEGAKRLGWLGVKGDTYQLQGVCGERAHYLGIDSVTAGANYFVYSYFMAVYRRFWLSQSWVYSHYEGSIQSL